MQIDELIRGTVPGLDFAIRRNHLLYGAAKLGWIIELAPYAVSVNVLFLGGADFPNAPPLGTTDRTRYIKLTDLRDSQRSELRDWIRLATRTPGWR
jgi:hypothetical protein